MSRGDVKEDDVSCGGAMGCGQKRQNESGVGMKMRYEHKGIVGVGFRRMEGERREGPSFFVFFFYFRHFTSVD